MKANVHIHGNDHSGWHWSLKSFDDRLMTPDRFISSGIVETLKQALWTAQHAWDEFTAGPDWQMLHHSEVEE